jgi:hypothetical protein
MGSDVDTHQVIAIEEIFRSFAKAPESVAVGSTTGQKCPKLKSGKKKGTAFASGLKQDGGASPMRRDHLRMGRSRVDAVRAELNDADDAKARPMVDIDRRENRTSIPERGRVAIGGK